MTAKVTHLSVKTPDPRQARFESALARAMTAALEAARQGLPPRPVR